MRLCKLRHGAHDRQKQRPSVENLMKISQHPASIETDITCTCGATVHTRSTVPNVRVAVCSNCHPFFTGRQKMVDTTGRVEAFQKKYGTPLA